MHTMRAFVTHLSNRITLRMKTPAELQVTGSVASPKSQTWREQKWGKLGVGQYVVGTMERDAFMALEFKRFGDHGRQKFIADCNDVSPVAVTLYDAQTLRTLAKMYSALPLDHPEQVSDSTCVWVGFEVLRGKRGRVVTWECVRAIDFIPRI